MLYLLYALAAAVLVGIDQLVKHLIVAHLALHETMPLIPGIIRLTYVQNSGAAFSVLSGQRWLLIAVTLACLAFVAGVLIKGSAPAVVNWSLVAVFGGAVGNLIDRIRLGYVVDMFEVEFIRFAVFNAADIFVVCGGIVMAVGILFFWQGGAHGSDA